MDVNLRVIGTQWTDANPITISAQRTGGNLRAEIAYSYRQIPTRGKGRIENIPDTGEVFTIFLGSHQAGKSRHACNRYTKEVKHLL